MPCRRRVAGPLALLALVASAPGCGDESPTASLNGENSPTIAPIADQTVVRNALTPGTFSVDLEIDDADEDRLDVTLDSDDEAVLADTTLTCDVGSCRVTLAPAPDATAHVTITVTVADGDRGADETSFAVHVVPLLVTTTEDDGAGSLRRVVADARPGDVVGFDTDGEFASARTLTLRSQIVLDRALTVEGPGAQALTVSGGGAVRVFKVAEGATVELRDLTIADGGAPLESFSAPDGTTYERRLGGGVLVDAGGRLTLRDAVVSGNTAVGSDAIAGGGGVGAFESTLIVLDSRITGNTASYGGGIHTVSLGGSEAATTIEGTIVAENAATSDGGGIAILNGSTVLRASRISDNTAFRGGGIVNYGTVVLEAESRVSANEATDLGGGLFNTGTATVDATVIEANTAARGAGAYNHERGTLALRTNSRVSDNATTGTDPSRDAGGGIASWGALTVRETVIAGNRAASGGGLAVGAGVVAIDDSTVRDNAGSGTGGGILIGAGRLSIRSGSAVENNTARDGGGIAMGSSDAVLAIEESGVVANEARGRGGGLYVGAGTITVTGTSCLIVGNVADADGDGSGSGGGIYHGAGDISGVPAERVCFNQPDDIAG